MKLFGIKLTSDTYNFAIVEANLVNIYKHIGYNIEMLATFDELIHQCEVLKTFAGKRRKAIQLEQKYTLMHQQMAAGTFGMTIQDGQDENDHVVPETVKHVKAEVVKTEVRLEEIVYNDSVIKIRPEKYDYSLYK